MSGYLKKISVLVLFICTYFSAAAYDRVKVDSLEIYFRRAIGIYEPGHRHNRSRMDSFIERVSALQQDSLYRISKISYICEASTSPEGDFELNEALTRKRANSITAYLHQYLTFNDEDVEIILNNEDYDGLARMVEASDMPHRDEVLNIIHTQPLERTVDGFTFNPRKGMLVHLYDGEVWQYMKEHFFPFLRHFKLIVTLEKPAPKPAVEYPALKECRAATLFESKVAAISHIETIKGCYTPLPQLTTTTKTAEDKMVKQTAESTESTDITEVTDTATDTAISTKKEVAAVESSVTTSAVTSKTTTTAKSKGVALVFEKFFKGSDDWSREILVKSNAVGWAMFIANAAVEIDIIPHLSFSLPIYYSGIDYFSSRVRFRMFGVYPEFRYYIKERDGLFVGLHAGMAYYNFAIGGDWRVQDKDGRSPALGGGINVGYRMPLLKKNSRWKMEFTLGAGVYDVHYERFVNTDNGPKEFGSVHKTVFALDNVGVNFSYSFGVKKGDKR